MPNRTNFARFPSWVRQACIELRDLPFIRVVRLADRLGGPALLPMIVLPWVVADLARRLPDYPHFRRLRATLSPDFWNGIGPFRHYLRMIAHWQQNLAVCAVTDRLHEDRWRDRIAVRGTPPQRLPEWGQRPVILACFHTGGFNLSRHWLCSQGVKAASLVRGIPTIIRRVEPRQPARVGTEVDSPKIFHVREIRSAVRFLAPGRVLVVALDASPPSRQMMVGAPMGINDGAARLATLSGAILMPVSVRKKKWMRLELSFGTPVPDEMIERGEIDKANEYLTAQLWQELVADPCAAGWTTLEAYAPRALLKPRLGWP